jgi:hypothetical protein
MKSDGYSIEDISLHNHYIQKLGSPPILIDLNFQTLCQNTLLKPWILLTLTQIHYKEKSPFFTSFYHHQISHNFQSMKFFIVQSDNKLPINGLFNTNPMSPNNHRL